MHSGLELTDYSAGSSTTNNKYLAPLHPFPRDSLPRGAPPCETPQPNRNQKKYPIHPPRLGLGNENSAQSFSDRSFFEPPWGHGRPRLRVMDVRTEMLAFPGFRGPDRSFCPRTSAGISAWRSAGYPAPKLTLWAAFSFLKDGWSLWLLPEVCIQSPCNRKWAVLGGEAASVAHPTRCAVYVCVSLCVSLTFCMRFL